MIKLREIFTTKERSQRILVLIRDHWFRLFLAMLCMLVMAASTAATAFLVKPVLDDIFFKQDQRMLLWVPVAVLIIYFIRGLGYYGQEYLMNHVGESIIRRLRDSIYVRMMDLDLSFFQAQKTGALMSRITNDVNIIKAMVSTAVTGSLRDFFTIIGLTVVIFIRDWKMAIFALVILPLAFYPVVEFGRRVRKVSTGCQEAMAELTAFLHETIVGAKIVKAFSMEAREKKRFCDKTEDIFKLEMKAVVARSLSSPIMEFLGGLGIAFIIWYGGSRVIEGTHTAGTFFSFMAAVLMLYDPVKKISRVNNAVQQGLAAADRVYEIIEQRPCITDPETPRDLPGGAHGVTFENVWFGYSDRPVLRDINLSVSAGEVLALVGASGGGKTSLVNLIPRFYDVTRGSIRVDGTDIRELSIASLRKRIAIVTQDPILFNDTIYNNIAYGNPEADPEAVREAARAAFAHDFVTRFPDGYDTVIGDLGGRLSGGEKQRICIARALLKDAPILILDEATSSLDTESEMLVQKALENLMKGRTTFVIAHRLSTICNADRIIALVEGEVIEEGTHNELMALKGEYCKLHQLQYAGNADGGQPVDTHEEKGPQTT